MSEPLSAADLDAALSELPGWTHAGGALHKRFQLDSFPEAIAFITRFAFDAERLGHHPELQNVYSTVEVRLTTHDSGNCVTGLDVALARAIEAAR